MLPISFKTIQQQSKYNLSNKTNKNSKLISSNVKFKNIQTNFNSYNLKKIYKSFSLIFTGLILTPKFNGANTIDDINNNCFKCETNINGVVDNFKQGTTNDCWLLSQLNGLSNKRWGKKVIKNSIKSDETGGAIITLQGAKNEQKDYRISKEEISTVREKQNSYDDLNYSLGDDDVLALELAIEKYFNLQGEQTLDGFKIKDRSLTNIIGLLSENSERKSFIISFENSDTISDYTQLLNRLEKRPNRYIILVGFRNSNNINLKNDHAYELKRIQRTKNGNKIVTVINPHDNSKEIHIDYYTFLKELNALQCYSRPNKSIEILKEISYEELNKKISKYKPD